jgi:hypothetical protein
MTQPAIDIESKKSMTTLMVDGTFALNATGDPVHAVDRTRFPLNIVWVRQKHATLNATVVIEASPFAPEDTDTFWTPIARLTADTTLDATCRNAMYVLPIGAWRLFRARVVAQDGVGAVADAFITSHTMSQ